MTLSDSIQLDDPNNGFNSVVERLQAAATDAADTLLRLLQCGDSLIELRAAKIILQIAQKNAELAEIKKKAAHLEKAADHQAERIEELTAANKVLQACRNDCLELKTNLIRGTFTRPEWMSAAAWDRMIRGGSSLQPNTT